MLLYFFITFTNNKNYLIKNSSIISPVFGIKNENEKVNIYQTSNVKNIEDEIQKTEEILDELKKLKERIEK